MRIPKKIKSRLKEIEKKEAAQVRAEMKERAEEQKAERAVENLRASRKKELMKFAESAANWLNDFWKSKDGRKTVKKAVYCYGLVLFSSDAFWKGKPSKPDVGVCTGVILNDSGELIYFEKYKWFPPQDTSLGVAPIRPKDLFAKLHPDFLRVFAKHLKSGRVWDSINREIKPI